MKILHVNHRDIRHPRSGGLEIVAHELSRRWMKKGHEVSILSSGFSGCADEETADGIRIFRTGREQIFNFIAGYWLRRHGWLGADIVIEHLSKVACFIPWFLSDRPFLVHVPHLFGRSIFEEVSWLPGSYVYGMEQALRWAYRKYPVWALSQSTKEDLIAKGFSEQRVDVVSGGVDTASFDSERRPSKEPTVLYVGRIRRYKGLVDPLLKAWPEVLRRRSDARLQMIGRGDYQETLRHYISRNNLEKSVQLMGYVNEAKKLELIRSAWFAVYPSVKEGWGLPVIEAGAAGIPTVASDSPGLRDAVRDGETGLLVPHGDVGALARAILRLIEDGDLRRRLGDEAKIFSRNFDWDRMAERVLELIWRHYPKLARV